MIPNALADRFSPIIRARGQQLYTGGAVRTVQTSDTNLLGLVQGSVLYPVTVGAEPGEISLTCACPYARNGDACKHQWALLLAADANGALAQLRQTAGDILHVTMVQTADDEDDDAPVHTMATTAPERPASTPTWEFALDRARVRMQAAFDADEVQPVAWPTDRRVVYVVDVAASKHTSGLVVEVATEKLTRDGSWSTPKRFTYPSSTWLAAPDPVDREIARELIGAAPLPDYGTARTSFVLAPRAYPTLLRTICETGRARLKTPGTRTHLLTLRWDDGGATQEPWRFVLSIKRTRGGEHVLEGSLVRKGETLALNAPAMVHESGLVIVRDSIARFDHDGLYPMIAELQSLPGMAVGRDLSVLLRKLYALPRVPAFSLPQDLAVAEVRDAPSPVLTIVANPTPWLRENMAGLQLTFRYGKLLVQSHEAGDTRFCTETSTLHHRDLDFETDARDRVLALGAQPVRDSVARDTPFVIPRARVATLALHLAQQQWHVAADGRAFRSPGAVRASVTSGVDWFDLRGTVDYGGVDVSLADVIEAQRTGNAMITLSDGSYGLLPSEWLARLGPLLGVGTATGEATRFKASQVAMLDALLLAMPDADLDETFATARQELARFDQVAPADPPPGFVGTLREYQREGLGWLHFLRQFGFGGCLADDMGLGKTVQVLAMLEERRAGGHGPSLVVVPRSLVFNWRREAERFAPAMRVLDWSETDRRAATLDTADVDLMIVTYGTLRRDAAQLAAIEFDYAVLDEAQAIKNAGTATAKAARLLKARHRLALSGTPIENRIEELWSVLDFLNPGMLGASSRFASMLRSAAVNGNGTIAIEADDGDADAELEGGDRALSGAEGELASVPGIGVDTAASADDPSPAPGDDLLARALRPVILRRTKSEVAPDLPERLERTYEVELEPKQRAFYNSLRDGYRASLLQRVDRDGLQKSRMHILEALLRLRQAACHPVLADSSKTNLPSAKLDALLPALAELRAEGHKALVFSQFTEFLALLRKELDTEGVTYEYLDGRTRDRQSRVDRFQSDPACPLFLISLKAGGHGLNLTSADYVYLLDPWWNPAVEAQAIDRAHRIGRTRRVIATRLVARDTIEEKILELQASKRALADAILTADKGVMASIGREELELLLG